MLIQGYGYGTGSDGSGGPILFPTTMRTAPTVTESNSADGGSSTGLTINNISSRGCSPEGFNNGSGQSIYYTMNLTANAEL